MVNCCAIFSTLLSSEELEGEKPRWQRKSARSVCVESMLKSFKVAAAFIALGEISYSPQWIASLQGYALLGKGKGRGNLAF